MKFPRILMAAVLIALAIGVSASPVEAQQFGSYTSGINIQNISATPASVTLHYYVNASSSGSGGTKVNQSSVSIPAYGVSSIFPLPVAAGFKGSILMESTAQIAAVANVGNSALSSLDAYVGLTSGSQQAYLPLLHKGNSGYTTWFSVQNTGAAPTTAKIKYTDTTGTNPDVTLTNIPPGASVIVNQANEAFHTKKYFAGTVTADPGGQIGVTVLQENTRNILAYTGFRNGVKMPIMPTINMNNNGYVTGTQIYNLSNVSTKVTVRYTAGQAGSDCQETQTIPARTMNVFTLMAFPSKTGTSNCSAARFIGSAQVVSNSANADLAVIVNQLRTSNNTNGASHNAFDVATATGAVYMPTIFDRNSGWYTAFNLINVSSGTAFVKCTYANTSVTFTTGSAGLAPGKSVTVSQFNAIRDRYIGSALCKTYTNNSYTTVKPDGKILAVVNQLGPGGPDNLLSYNAINGK